MGLLRKAVVIGALSLAATQYDGGAARLADPAPPPAPSLATQAQEAYRLCRAAGEICAAVAAAGVDSAKERLMAVIAAPEAEAPRLPAAVPLPPRRPKTPPAPQKP